MPPSQADFSGLPHGDAIPKLLTGAQFPRLLISDFDGTITKLDFYECVLAEIDSPQCQDAWQQFVAGSLTHFEALRVIFAALPGDEAEVLRIARLTQIDPRFPNLVRRLEQAGWGVLVVSAGCDWYIHRLLAELDVELPVIANPGRLSPGSGLELIAPTDSPYFDRETGIDKAAVVRAAQRDFERVAFAGNGRADLAAARLVAPDLRFATGWLAEQLDERREAYQPFESWADIAEQLISR